MEYSSGKIKTKDKFDFTYGRIEARIKLPKGDALWPAFWMLPSNFDGIWASGGEIDIMESFNQMTTSQGTLHFGGSWPDNENSGECYLTAEDVTGRAGASFSGNFHQYAMEWDKDEFRWFVDSVHLCTKTEWYSDTEDGEGLPFPGKPPFNAPFHLILNLAIGSTNTAYTKHVEVDESALPAKMKVDYVRVYQTAEEQEYIPPVYTPENQPYDYINNPESSLVFEDNFNELDDIFWTAYNGEPCQYGCNNELNGYSEEAVSIKKRKYLQITAKESPLAFGGRTYDYISGRVTSKDKFSFTWGRVEVRMKPPKGKGLQALIKLLPVDDSVEWPSNGDITVVQITDKMEDAEAVNYWGTAEDPHNSAEDGVSCHSEVAGHYDEGYHVYAVEWESWEMRWYVDGYIYCRERGWYEPGTLEENRTPYVSPFYIAFDLAVGGELAQYNVQDNNLPSTMSIDYVRVYQRYWMTNSL
ncbi:unnamed protein product [Discosporangium mesarthrocarpum]